MDERYDGIGDSCFIVNMTGFNPRRPASYTLVDRPGIYHGNGATLSYADGHAQIHKWFDSRTTSQPAFYNLPNPGSRDVEWLQEHSSAVQ